MKSGSGVLVALAPLLFAAAAGAAPSRRQPVGAMPPQVFIGAVYEPQRLSDPYAVAALLETGRIGLYWHFTGFYHQILDGTAAGTVALWEKHFAAVAEIPYSTTIPASDTVLAIINHAHAPTELAPGVKTVDRDGRSWSVVIPNLLVALDGRPQHCFRPAVQAYILPSGSVCLVDVQSDSTIPVYLGANAIAAFASPRPHLEIKASDPVPRTTSRPPDQAPTGRPGLWPDPDFFTRTDPGGFRGLFTARQDVVREINVNIDYQTSHTALDIAVFRHYADAARIVGVTSIAPILQPDQSYETGCARGCFLNAFNVVYRQMAIYGNGVAFDAPPWHVLHYGMGYIRWYEGAIGWARQQGIRSSWIVSPMPNAQDTFQEDMRRLLAILKRDDALPSQWIVENYRTQPGATTVENDSDPGDRRETIEEAVYTHPYRESLNAVARLLAQLGNVAPPAPDEAQRLTIVH